MHTAVPDIYNVRSTIQAHDGKKGLLRAEARIRPWSSVLAGLLLFLAMLVASGCGAPEAARLVEGWSVKSVADTFDTTPDGRPSPPLFALDAGRLIYLDGSGGDYRVMLWEESTGRQRQLGEQADSAVSPELAGDYALWFTKQGSQSLLMLRQLKFGVVRDLAAVPAQPLDRHLSEERVVYGRLLDQPGQAVMTFEFDTVTTKELARTPFSATGPATDGHRVVWIGEVNGSPEVFMRDLSTGKTTQLTQNGEYSKYGLRLSGDLVTWIEGSGRTVDVYVLNLRSGKTTHLGSMDNATSSPRRFPRRAVPQTDGRYVVWERSADERWQVVVYDSANGQSRNVSGSYTSDFDPKLGDGFVVWERYQERGGTTLATVMAYDLAKGSAVQLSDDAYDSVWPEISGKQVAWWEYDRTGRELVRRLMLATRP